MTSAEAGYACLNSSNPSLRRAAAHLAPLAPEELAYLFDDADMEVACIAAARHPNPPGAVLERLVFGRTGLLPVGRRLLNHRGFPSGAWVRLAGSEEYWARCAAAKYPDLSAEIVGHLARDPEPRVRAAAAGHRNLPPECIADLLVDSGWAVPESMGESPALTVGWMNLLLAGAGC